MVICPARETANTIQHSYLWKDNLHVCVGTNHELAQTLPPISLVQPSKFPAIFSEKGSGIREAIESLFLQAQLSLNLGFEISTIDAIKAMVEQGLGWSLFPDSFHSDKLKVLEVQDINLSLSFHIYYLKKRAEDKNIQSFVTSFLQWQNPEERNKDPILW